MKKPTVRSLKRKLWPIFSEYVRLRDCLFTTRTLTHGKCITCGVCLPIKKLQAGHYVSGRRNSILFDEESVHAQCVYCNKFKNGAPVEYRKAIQDLYGNGYHEVLEKRAKEIRKFTVPELEDLIEEYRFKIKKLKGGQQ
jgi:hypothetical protein